MACLELQQLRARREQTELEVLHQRMQLLDSRRSVAALRCQEFTNQLEQAISASADNSRDAPARSTSDSSTSDQDSPSVLSPHGRHASRRSFETPAHVFFQVGSSSGSGSSSGRRLSLEEASRQLHQHELKRLSHPKSFSRGSADVISPLASADMTKRHQGRRSQRMSFDMDSQAVTYYGWSRTARSASSRRLSASSRAVHKPRASLELTRGAWEWDAQDESTGSGFQEMPITSGFKATDHMVGSSTGEGRMGSCHSSDAKLSPHLASLYQSSIMSSRRSPLSRGRVQIQSNSDSSFGSRVTFESMPSEGDGEGSSDNAGGAVLWGVPLGAQELPLSANWLADSHCATGLVNRRHPIMPASGLGTMSAADMATAGAFQGTDVEDAETSEASDAGEFLQNVDRSRPVWARRASLDLPPGGTRLAEMCHRTRSSGSSSSDVSIPSSVASKETSPGKKAAAGAVGRQIRTTLSMARRTSLGRFFSTVTV